MFQVKLDKHKCKPQLTSVMSVLLLTTECATNALFEYLLNVRRYSILTIYSTFDITSRHVCHQFLNHYIEQLFLKNGDPLIHVANRVKPHERIKLTSLVYATNTDKNTIFVDWWLADHITDFAIDYSVSIPLSTQSITLNDIKW